VLVRRKRINSIGLMLFPRHWKRRLPNIALVLVFALFVQTPDYMVPVPWSEVLTVMAFRVMTQSGVEAAAEHRVPEHLSLY
jgi:hypothetical protein